MTNDDIIFQIFQAKEVDIIEYLKYLKTHESLSDKINRIRKAIEEYEINRK